MNKEIYKCIQDFLTPEYKLLDIGCGKKDYSSNHKCKEIITIDAWENVNPDILLDVSKNDLPFVDNYFDIILLIDVIEHLTKEEGLFLLNNATRVCKNKIILLTPLFWDDNSKNVNNDKLWCYGNVFNLHKSLWVEDDFQSSDNWNKININTELPYYFGYKDCTNE